MGKRKIKERQTKASAKTSPTSMWLRITPELQAAADAVRKSWSDVLWRNFFLYELNRVDLKAENADKASAALVHAKAFCQMLSRLAAEERKRQQEWLEKNKPADLGEGIEHPTKDQKTADVATLSGALIALPTKMVLTTEFDEMVQDVCATAKNGIPVPGVTMELAQAYVAAFDAEGIVRCDLVNPSTDYLWEIEEAQLAFEKWFKAVVSFLRLACGLVQEVPNQVTITSDMAVLIDGKSCTLSKVQELGLFVLALLRDQAFTTEEFMRKYTTGILGSTDKGFYHAVKEVQKIAPCLTWESSGKRWVKGLLFEIHAPNSALEKHLNTLR
jgi:hypothetical protein